LAPLPNRDVDTRFRPVDALASAGRLPILLTGVGRERAEIAATVEAFIAAADHHRTNLDVIDVPEGRHGFDTLDHTESSRSAVTQAMSWVITNLRH
jgi:hypothetical protein